MASAVCPVVEISDGKLRGKEWEIVNGEKVLAFLGIPYGKAPVGELRFKAPVPAEPWSGVRDATKDGNPCYGLNIVTQKTRGSEDCLFLNVFTKSVGNQESSPVMVFIHGGAFVRGSNASATYSPDYLLTQDVVLVAMNYRLGISGFLSLADPSLEIPGNAGLKDQLLALKWVQRNINQFGGDPNNVTIFGESAGSGSVHYHLMSPASEGLFHKAILQSGTVYNPWPYGTAQLVDVLAHSGIRAENEISAFEQIRDMPIEELYEIQETFMNDKGTCIGVFAPVVEKPNPTAFVIEEPVDILTSGKYNKVPVILGYCDKESLTIESEAYQQMFGLPEDCDPIVQDQVALFSGLDKESSVFQDLMKIYEKFYLDSGMKDGRVLLTSDLLFIRGIITSAKLHAATSDAPVYLFRLSIETSLNGCKKLTNTPFIKGACHGDDLSYLFRSHLDCPIKSLQKGSDEELAVNRIVKMWTNFARYSDPTPPGNDIGITWPALEKDVINFLDINKTLSVGIEPENERYPIWMEVEDFYRKHHLKLNGSKSSS